VLNASSCINVRTVSFGCSCGTSISTVFEMDSKTDKLVQTIVTHSNDRLKPVMRFSCALSACRLQRIGQQYNSSMGSLAINSLITLSIQQSKSGQMSQVHIETSISLHNSIYDHVNGREFCC
jgi:hypothetical protein